MIYYTEIPETKKFKIGMYGGKFLPFHTGHKFCTDVASKLCEKLYLILFYGGDQEQAVAKSETVIDKKLLSIETRWAITQKVAKMYDNVTPVLIDVTDLKLPDGTEDWDAETPLVLEQCGRLNAAFSSEPKYDDYFQRAYPWAKHVLIDPPRIVYPISGTLLRETHDKTIIEKGLIK